MRVRNKISKSNPYYISSEKYLELFHFCLQYDEWKEELNKISLLPSSPEGYLADDPTGEIAVKRALLKNKIELVEQCAKETDKFIGGYILAAVTKRLSYNTLYSKYRIPCGKDYYFERYRRFFYLLAGRR